MSISDPTHPKAVEDVDDQDDVDGHAFRRSVSLDDGVEGHATRGKF